MHTSDVLMTSTIISLLAGTIHEREISFMIIVSAMREFSKLSRGLVRIERVAKKRILN